MGNWQGVEVRHLAALAAIHEERSFRGAANRLGYVQSAVSQQISRLERLVGDRLVERTPGQAAVTLTPVGQVLLEHGKRMLWQLEAARADVAALSGESGGALRIGSSASVAARVLARAVRALAPRISSLSVTMVEESSDRALCEAVSAGDLDAAVVERPLDHGPFASLDVLVDPPVLVLQADSPLARSAEPPTLRKIADLPLIGHPSWRGFDVVQEEFRRRELDPRFRFSADSDGAVQALVAAGLGAAIMPQLCVHQDDTRVVAVPLAHALPPRTLALVWHSERRIAPELAAFRAALLIVCGSRTRDERTAHAGSTTARVAA